MKSTIEETTLKILNTMASKIIIGKRKKIKTDELEKQVKKNIGPEAYRNLGGYALFAPVLELCVTLKILSEIRSSKSNKRMPPIKKAFWLNGTKEIEIINHEKFFLEMGDLINFEFYMMHKKLLTSQECLKIERIYQFLKNKKENSVSIQREERSLMLFYDLDTDDIEPEKYLSTSKGKSFLARIGLEIDDLNCKVVKEPYKYWKLPQCPFDDTNDVLIVEGLATFHTFQDMLKLNDEWVFGCKPQMVIFGSGKRILSSFEYTDELFGDRKNIKFRYFGDLDPEGYSIYCHLKKRYGDYLIFLDADCYRFMYEHTQKFAVNILREQVMDVRSLTQVSQELENEIPGIKKHLEELWRKKMRIAQEAMNLQIIQNRKE